MLLDACPAPALLTVWPETVLLVADPVEGLVVLVDAVRLAADDDDLTVLPAGEELRTADAGLL